MTKEEFEKKMESYVFELYKKNGMEDEELIKKALSILMPEAAKEQYGAFLLIMGSQMEAAEEEDVALIASKILAKIGNKEELMGAMMKWYPTPTRQKIKEQNNDIFQ